MSSRKKNMNGGCRRRTLMGPHIGRIKKGLQLCCLVRNQEFDCVAIPVAADGTLRKENRQWMDYRF